MAAVLPPAPTTIATSTNKFVGIYDARDGTKNTSIAFPIHGLITSPEIDLAASLGQIKAECLARKLPYPSEFDHLAGNVYVANKFVDAHWHRLSSLYGHRGMTKTRATFINFYTHESPFYTKLNACLRDEKRQFLVPYFCFIKAFLCGLYCLPLCPGNVKRGVKCDLRDQYSVGDEATWWSFTSTTAKVGVLQSDQFLGTTGKRTMFDITARSLVSIKEFSGLPEEESILLPGTIYLL